MRRLACLVAGTAVLALAAQLAAAAPVVVSASGDKPWVFVDRQGVTHVAWDVTTGSQTQTFYRRALPGSTSFSAPVAIPFGTGEDFAGVFVTQYPAPSNRLLMVTSRCCALPETFASTSDDGGATWSAPVAVAEDGPSVNPAEGRVNLVANGPLGVYVINGNPTTRLIKVPASLTPIVPQATITDISPNPYDGQVAFDSAGQPVFGFGSLKQGFVRVGEAGVDQVVGTSEVVSSIHLAGGGNGVTALFYGGPVLGNQSLTARRVLGGTLSAPVTVATGTIRTPYLGANQANGFDAVWANRNGGGRIYWSRSADGSSWSRPGPVSDRAGVNPVVSGAADGSGWAVYQEDGGSRILATPLVITDPSFPDTSGIANPVVRRRGSQIYVTPRNPSLADLRNRKCVNVRVQTAKPAVIRVAIFSGRRSIRVFGSTVVRFAAPGKKLVCIRVPLRARTFNVRQPFRFAFAAKAGAHPKRNAPAVVTTSGFTTFR